MAADVLCWRTMAETPTANPARLLLYQLLPILAFLAIDALVEDPAWAIGAALLLVGIQAALDVRRTRRLDPLLLVDVALLAGLAAGSLLTDDQRFFLLKPAILEGLMVPYLGFLALAPARTLEGYFRRTLGGAQFPTAALPMLRALLCWMAVLVLLHAGLVVAVALYGSRALWGLVSGPGFYAMLLPLAAWVLIQRRRLLRAARPKRLRDGSPPPARP